MNQLLFKLFQPSVVKLPLLRGILSLKVFPKRVALFHQFKSLIKILKTNDVDELWHHKKQTKIR